MSQHRRFHPYLSEEILPECLSQSLREKRNFEIWDWLWSLLAAARRCDTSYNEVAGSPRSPGSAALLPCLQAQPLGLCTQEVLASLLEKYRLVFKIGNLALFLWKPTVNLPKTRKLAKGFCTAAIPMVMPADCVICCLKCAP